ncbi:MAG: hypothetical protein M0Z61_10345 [Nitrospiraceae bacterium]|nr:hypothetical protein [Nitrospiraceae bacterium]
MKMKMCTCCVLPDTFPGIRFDSDGVCNYCEDHRQEKEDEELRNRYRQKFEGLLEKLRSGAKRPYDAIMAYSGGKDSSYSMKMLKEQFGLKILSVTFDHGFVSEQVRQNIRRVTAALNIDQMTISPGRESLCDAFRRSESAGVYPMKYLERASAICNTCMGIVKSYLLKTAIETGVPLICYGWSPGQAPVQASVMKVNLSMIKKMQETTCGYLEKVAGKGLDAFMPSQRHFKMLEAGNGGFLYNVHPLAFMGYDEEAITGEISRLGWRRPAETDDNSSNCLLNSYAIHVHMRDHGFHPYAFEIAALVRKGYLSREEGIRKLAGKPSEEVVNNVRSALGGVSPWK